MLKAKAGLSLRSYKMMNVVVELNIKKMKDEKILISQNRDAGILFRRDCENVMNRANDLIRHFQIFQQWKKIETLNDFIELVADPGALFDKVLLSNVNISVTGNIKLVPEKVADLLGIHRAEYLNLVAGLPIDETYCKPCQKAKIKKGERSISLHEYEGLQEYLIFSNGLFELDEPAIQSKAESLAIYATTPEQIETYNHWMNLCNMINEHKKRGLLATDDFQGFAKKLGLSFSFGDYLFHCNEMQLRAEVFKIKK